MPKQASPCTTLQPAGSTCVILPISVRTPLSRVQATTATATTRVRGSLVVPVASVPKTRSVASMRCLLYAPVKTGWRAPEGHSGQAV